MASVTIDAGVLAVPPEGSSVNTVHKYIDTLLDWRKLLGKQWVAIYMSMQASQALFDDGLYPLRDKLSSLFATNRIVHADVNTVATLINTLLQLTPSFETCFRVRDVLTEELSAEPDILRQSAGDKLQANLARCVTLIGILRRYCGDTMRNHLLILRYTPEPVVTVQAAIQVLDHDRNDLDELPMYPEMFKGNVLICDDFRGFVKCLDESFILVNSTDELGLEIAIRIALYKSRLGGGEDPDWDDLRGLRIGHEFFRTVKNVCMAANALPGKILRSIVETLERKNMGKVHALRTGRHGNDPQRMRGADRGMRRDIDRDHHLHYWLCRNNVVELASVSYPHDNFWIPQ